MNFQNLHKIENYQFYLDLAFRRAREHGKKMREEKLKGGRLEKSKYIELRKMGVISDTIASRMNEIVQSFPRFDELPDFYKELVRINIDYGQLKRSLGAVNWLSHKAREFFRIYKSKFDKNKLFENVNKFRREFLGRISSMVRQIRHDLEFLEEARKVMKEFPIIKTSLKTVAIAGFPNVGKTTLLSKLTGSKPEIMPYPFTTKGINVGYFEKDGEKIQVLDIPGTLDRFEKMNDIEKVAYLAIKYVADTVVYVFDLTEEYPLEKQEQLLKRLEKDFGRKIIVFVSKTDILDSKIINGFLEKHKEAITDLGKLKEKIVD
jgi:nucleolar GTP-binding protein